MPQPIWPTTHCRKITAAAAADEGVRFATTEAIRKTGDRIEHDAAAKSKDVLAMQ